MRRHTAWIMTMLVVALLGRGAVAACRRQVVDVALLAAGYVGELIFTAESGLGDDESGQADDSPGGDAAGDEVGLYGGTARKTNCNKEQLVQFLEKPENADKADAWAAVHGIQRTQIRAYVTSLTPLVLRRDTLVKNHGYQKSGAKGKAAVFYALLQAGVAILVDRFGLPAVRCACGNPLLSPDGVNLRSAEVNYTGAQWASFKKGRTTVVRKRKPVVTHVFRDPAGNSVGRPAGTDGRQDKVLGPRQPPTPSPTPTPSRTASPEPSPTLSASPTPSRSPTPTVTVKVTVSPTSYTGREWPYFVTFTGVIKVTGGPVTVRYVWIRSNGTSLPAQTVTFTGTGPQQRTVTSTWAVISDGTYWQAIRIQSPRRVTSNRASFEYDRRFP